MVKLLLLMSLKIVKNFKSTLPPLNIGTENRAKGLDVQRWGWN